MNTLIEFTISHYCERARWALDHYGVPYVVETVLPGPHQLRLRRLGARRSSVPLLLAGDDVVQGSDRILDWAEVNRDPGRVFHQASASESEAIQAWEKRLDRDAGQMLRRLLYDSLLRRRRLVVEMWTQDGPSWGPTFYRFTMPLMERLLRRSYRIHPEGVARSAEVFAALADDLDAALAQRPFLVGDRFTRADLSAAALIAPLVMPPEHHVRWPAIADLPEDAVATRAMYADRPFFRWIQDLYRKHRRPAEDL